MLLEFRKVLVLEFEEFREGFKVFFFYEFEEFRKALGFF